MTIVVAGYTGLVCSAIYTELRNRNADVIGLNSGNLDLLNRKKVFEFFADLKPELVIDAAAIVGGIGANNSRPVDFLTKNLQIQSNLMDACHSANVSRFVFLGSSCIYPRNANQPIVEESLLTGELEKTNSAYAIAKIAGIELVKSYRTQFGHKWISLMPTNVYGPGDNFSLDNGHVLPSLIHRFVQATTSNSQPVVLWGSGSPLREFLYSKDLAKAVLCASERYDGDLHLNIGSGEEVSIFDLANLIGVLTKFHGVIQWDKSKPDGTPRKILDSTRIRRLEWSPETDLKTGLGETIEWFKRHYNEARR